MPSTVKKTSITLPKPLEKDLKKIAKEEHRSLSGVIQEAARYYLNIRKFEALQRELSLKASYAGVQTEEELIRLIHGTRIRIHLPWRFS